MSLPFTGEIVNIEYLEIDEIEAKCWIKEYSIIGYMDNTKLLLKLSDLESKDLARVSRIDSETGHVILNSCRIY